MIKGRCINADQCKGYNVLVFDTDVDNHRFGICSICFPAYSTTESQITAAVLGQ